MCRYRSRVIITTMSPENWQIMNVVVCAKYSMMQNDRCCNSNNAVMIGETTMPTKQSEMQRQNMNLYENDLSIFNRRIEWASVMLIKTVATATRILNTARAYAFACDREFWSGCNVPHAIVSENVCSKETRVVLYDK